MTDVTIREIRDLRELSDPPTPRREHSAPDEKAEREAALANALAGSKNDGDVQVLTISSAYLYGQPG